MAKSKNGKKLTPEEIKEIKEFEKEYEKLLVKMNGVRGAKKTSKRYKADRELILRLKAAAAVFVVSMGAIVAMSQDALAIDEQDERKICTLASIVLDEGQHSIKVEKDGVEIELDDNAIAIVEGRIEEGENNVLTYDKYGNRIEVSIDSENLNGLKEMSKDNLEDNYVIYEVISPEGADLIQTGEEVLNVSYGDFVLGKEQHDEVVDVLYPSEDELISGEIDESKLEIRNDLSTEEYQSQGLTKMVVKTSTVGYDRLNFRSSTNEEKYSIMMQIPNGTIVYATGETKTAEGREWTQIVYERETGWVATEFLEEVVSKEEQQEQEQDVGEYIESTGITNPSGGVTIIDVSTISANQLREILKNGIPTRLSSDKLGKLNTEGVAGNIAGVQMKIGASGYGKGEFKQTDYDAYKKLVAVCEELGVPYGFYFYATSTDIEQGKMEVEYVENAIRELEKEFDMKYNKLPFTWDRELTGTEDRQYGKDITDVVAYQINEIQSRGISEKVLLYMPGRIADENDSDRTIDLGKLKDKLTNPDDFAIWLCAPVTRNGNQTQSTAKYIDMIKNKYQIPVAGQQSHLDMNAGGEIDISSWEENVFYESIGKEEKDVATETTGEKENDVVTETTGVEDYERE